eukprot:CAMPEP_0205919426 /NCGR_PEP_ID=MMETSP1325-20131115/10442_1 /ASSEMBLY_ACC=CAM_ASM_000708 /TAXON_ID=236786 /ORGANISM="Florenciella sp., Strain RCC1007" /LENGTH=206 /DNA_ID=CAMNT_0053287037 /DNA_START=1 /DNA_END=621 /DNA_ORIENTATION=+
MVARTAHERQYFAGMASGAQYEAERCALQAQRALAEGQASQARCHARNAHSHASDAQAHAESASQSLRAVNECQATQAIAEWRAAEDEYSRLSAAVEAGEGSAHQQQASSMEPRAPDDQLREQLGRTGKILQRAASEAWKFAISHLQQVEALNQRARQAEGHEEINKLRAMADRHMQLHLDVFNHIHSQLEGLQSPDPMETETLAK